MAATTTVVCGAAGSGKTDWLVERYRQALLGGEPGGALWLAPNRRGVDSIRRRLISGRLPACLAPGVCTFERFAGSIVDYAPLALRPLSALLKRRLLKDIVAELAASGGLAHFHAIAHTDGFLDTLCEFVSELKRDEIWPDHFEAACRKRGLAAKDSDLLAIYRRYQDLVTAHQLFDAQGKFWSAREMLRQGHRGPTERLRLIVADGFSDFTYTQHEILELLAETADQIIISLPLEAADGPRSELFAKPRRTLDILTRDHIGLSVRVQALAVDQQPEGCTPTGGTAASPAMQAIAASLFSDPREAPPPVPSPDVEILASAGPLGEVQDIARRVKKLLTEGDEQNERRRVLPDEIVVVWRSLTAAAPLVREVFTEFGLPYAIESRRALGEIPAMRTLMSLFDLVEEDWPFRTLLAVVGNNEIRPLGERTAAARVVAEKAIRLLKLAHGREDLLNRVERGEARFLFALDRALGRLPESASPEDWAAALERLATDLGMMGDPDESSHAQAGAAAWDALLAALRNTGRLAGWLERSPPRWSRQDFFAAVREILRAQPLDEPCDESGCVRVLEAPSVRSLDVPYLFVAGLSEESFPARMGEDHVYQEYERRHLAELGLPLSHGAQRSSDEKLLFYEVITRARRRLWLSFPSLDDAAEPLLASPFLAEVERVLGGTLTRPGPPDLRPVPRAGLPLCATDLRVQGVDLALDEGNVSLLAAMLSDMGHAPAAEHILAGLEAIAARRQDDHF
ncbi:MAG: UvrD-helicase domain-containing protein, partial [Pirellulales bacterium]